MGSAKLHDRLPGPGLVACTDFGTPANAFDVHTCGKAGYQNDQCAAVPAEPDQHCHCQLLRWLSPGEKSAHDEGDDLGPSNCVAQRAKARTVIHKNKPESVRSAIRMPWLPCTARDFMRSARRAVRGPGAVYTSGCGAMMGAGKQGSSRSPSDNFRGKRVQKIHSYWYRAKLQYAPLDRHK